MAPTFPSRRLASAFASASASASTPSHGKRPLGLALLRRRKATSGNSFDARRGRAQKNACVAPSSSSSATQVEDESEIFSKLLETSFNIQGAANNGLGCRVEYAFLLHFPPFLSPSPPSLSFKTFFYSIPD
mmetsp:Transcript_8443/g.15652  ORF Transcript_8443/g.15652 Transcript_8443/m.15652 type:complete len:131 (+) Transcript_8443:84-476(+)